jgi:CHAT domain-containing protein
MVVKPTGDLPEANKEGERIQKVFADQSDIRITMLAREKATRPAILKAITSGEYDVMHYAGHAYFDPVNRSRSGIVCSGKTILSGADLGGLNNLPSLVFFNACESARVRGDRKPRSLGLREQAEHSIGLAEAFLRGGVANFVGTYWPVGDSSASTFAGTLYRLLLSGKPLGDAVTESRQTLVKANSIDWADYIHYGDFRFVIKRRQDVSDGQ